MDSLFDKWIISVFKVADSTLTFHNFKIICAY